MNSSNLRTNQLYTRVQQAQEVEKPRLLREFLKAAIIERERGELELSEVGSMTITLIGELKLPPMSALANNLTKAQRTFEELYRVAGKLDLAGQGGTTPAADEQLWQEFKQLVDRLY